MADAMSTLSRAEFVVGIVVHIVILAALCGSLMARVRTLENRLENHVQHQLEALTTSLNEVKSCVAKIKGYLEAKK
tara:strand:- start:77 stop:304 length:228 start_codon:yes stop_codon:yes gene_type:complete